MNSIIAKLLFLTPCILAGGCSKILPKASASEVPVSLTQGARPALAPSPPRFFPRLRPELLPQWMHAMQFGDSTIDDLQRDIPQAHFSPATEESHNGTCWQQNDHHRTSLYTGSFAQGGPSTITLRFGNLPNRPRPVLIGLMASTPGTDVNLCNSFVDYSAAASSNVCTPIRSYSLHMAQTACGGDTSGQLEIGIVCGVRLTDSFQELHIDVKLDSATPMLPNPLPNFPSGFQEPVDNTSAPSNIH